MTNNFFTKGVVTVLLLSWNIMLYADVLSEYQKQCDVLSLTHVDNDELTNEAYLRKAQSFMRKGDFLGATRLLAAIGEGSRFYAKARQLLQECEEKAEAQLERERTAYEAACSMGTVAALQDFISAYPNSEYRTPAQQRIDDHQLWHQAKSSNTINAYRHYLATSVFKAYQKEAEKAISDINALQEWQHIKNTKSVAILEDYLQRYPSSPDDNAARYLLAILKGELCYQEGNHSNAISYYEDAMRRQTLTDAPKAHYEELLLEKEYLSVKDSENEEVLVRFFSKLTASSPYYREMSNRIAIVKAKKLSGYSSDYNYAEALRYANDSYTRTQVNGYINYAKKRKHEIRHEELVRAHKRWWKRNFMVGWHLGADMLEETLSLRSGLRFRLGTSRDVFNINIGADYVYQAIWDMVYESPYDSQKTFKAYPISHQIAVPLTIKLNLTGGHSKSCMYIGCAAEWAYTLVEDDNFKGLTNDYSIAIDPQLGFNLNKVDWGFYYRKYLSGYNVVDSPYVDLEGQRVGMFLTFYF